MLKLSQVLYLAHGSILKHCGHHSEDDGKTDELFAPKINISVAVPKRCEHHDEHFTFRNVWANAGVWTSPSRKDIVTLALKFMGAA